MDYLEIGKIVNTFGIKGELKVVSESEFISDRFASGQTLYLGDDKIPVVVKSYRIHQSNVLLLLKNVTNINEVLKYRDLTVYIDKAEIDDLPDGYYLFQLIGLKVYHDENYLGEVVDTYKNLQTLLKIKTQDKEVLIPFVPAFIKKVDLEAGIIEIDIIEGLL